MNFREASIEDAGGIAVLLHAMGDLRSVIAESVAATAKKVERNLHVATATGSSTVFVAERPDGEIAGYCAVHWVPFLFFEGGEAYLTELFVRPADAGKGVGSTLLDIVITEARKRGCARVSLLNGRDGEAYRRKFYAKRGWVERERMANFVLPLADLPKHQDQG